MWNTVYSNSLPRMEYPLYQVSCSHNERTTTFRHPVTGEISPENAEFALRDEESSIVSPQQMNQRPYSLVSEGSTAVTTSTAETRPPPKAPKSTSKVYSFGKRDHSIKRNPDVPVLVRGWLYKQDSSGMKLWKRRWFLLSDYCLFYYKDSREEAILGSIPLPGYVISPAAPEDRINRKYSFKAVHTGMRSFIQQKDSIHRDHSGMRTYYFSADTQEDVNGWIRVMNQAALIQIAPESKRESDDMEWLPAPVNNHIDSLKEYAEPEVVQRRTSFPKPKEPFPSKPGEPRRDSGEKERYRDSGDQDSFLNTGNKERYHRVGDQERYGDAGDQERYGDAGYQERYGDAGDQERYGDAGDQERYGDAGDQDGFLKAGDKERYRGVGDKEQYRDTADKERLQGVGDKERYRDAGDKERWGGAGDTERFQGAGKKEHLYGAGDKERYRGAEDKERLYGAGDKERYQGAGDKERLYGAGDKERYQGAGDKERLYGAGDKERYRGAEEKKRWGDAGDKERYQVSGGQDCYRGSGDRESNIAHKNTLKQHARHKEHFWDAGDKERYQHAGDKERYRDTGNQESYIVHRNTITSNGGKPAPSFLSSNRQSAFTDFSKTHRSPAVPAPQPPTIERNGTLPPSFRMSAGPIEQNGTDTYKRRFVPSANPEKQGQRKSVMGQVEQWVKIQKGDGKSVGSEHPLPLSERYQTVPKTSRNSSGSSPPPSRNMPSDYKYAQDRVSHLKMSNQERQATKEGMVWQLYEWQQRQQFKHGSPTGQIYMGTLEAGDRTRAKSLLDVPRSISVPPSPSDIPPPAPPKAFPPRRPHTPAERLNIRPEDGHVDVPYIGSPQKTRAHTLKSTAHVDRLSMGYMTHTVSAPSLHGKSPEEITLLLIRLRRHQAKLGRIRNYTMAKLKQHKPTCLSYQADDTYIQLKKELDYLDLKIKYNEPLINLVHSVLRNSTPGYRTSINVTGRESLKDRSSKPIRIAESDVDVKLSILCEQDRILQDLEDKIRALKDNKDKLETVLEVLHRQMDQYKDQPQHTEKISYQQRLLQEDLVQIRAEMSKVSTDMENSWNEYLRLESDVIQLRQMLQEQMTRSPSSQDRAQLQKDLWRIEDVTAGLSSNKVNYKVLVESFKNPERKTVPLVTSTFVPSGRTAFTSVRGKSTPPQNSPSLVKQTLEVGLYAQPYAQVRSHSQPQLLQKPEPRLQSPTRLPSPPMLEEGAPPRPPLPDMYSPEDPPPYIPPPPALPPPPRESSVIRHTSVRGLKRQSDERKRDRELGQGVNGDYRVELRTYVSDPELANLGDSSPPSSGFLGSDSGYQTLPIRGLSGSTSRLPQSSSIASYVTLRRGTTTDSYKDRPKSAFERLYSGDNQRGKMSAEEQLQRMKRHQKALVRERKRTLSQGDKQSVTHRPPSRPVSADVSSWKREQDFDFQLLERAARDVEDREKDDQDWIQAKAIHVSHVTELDLEPQDYDLDISKELSTPNKVEIPERYIEMDPDEPLSREELDARYRKVEKIKNILARSSVHNLQPTPYHEEPTDLDFKMQEQERMITISYALASEASQRSKQVAAHAVNDQ